MANVLVEEQVLSDIASQIRSQLGYSTSFKPSTFNTYLSQIDDRWIKRYDLYKKSYSNSEITYIGSYAFTYMSVSQFKFDNVTWIGDRAFNACGLSSIYINSELLPKVSDIHTACFAATNIIGVSLSLLKTVGTSAFYYCSKLSEVNLSVCSIINTSAFGMCQLLSNVSIPAVTTISSAAFYYCSNIPAISLPNTTNIGSGAFSGCSKLSSVYAPALISAGWYAFAYCTGLSEISLLNLNSVITSLFYRCSELKTVHLSNVSIIYNYGFNGCVNLLSLYLHGSSVCALSNTNAFSSTPISTYTTSTGGVRGSIYVPSSLYATYIASTNWVTYSSRFVSM